MQIWRVSRTRYAAAAFTGEGSRRNEGRWHAAGMPVVYTSFSLALASVEVFVNLDLHIDPPEFVAIPVEIEETYLHDRVELKDLPENWREVPSLVCRAAGSQWFATRRSVALVVPSAAVMHEWNVLLNPEHPDFARLTIGEPQPFRFDRRMFRRA